MELPSPEANSEKLAISLYCKMGVASKRTGQVPFLVFEVVFISDPDDTTRRSIPSTMEHSNPTGCRLPHCHLRAQRRAWLRLLPRQKFPHSFRRGRFFSADHAVCLYP